MLLMISLVGSLETKTDPVLNQCLSSLHLRNCFRNQAKIRLQSNYSDFLSY
jgi:hypothetical protein